MPDFMMFVPVLPRVRCPASSGEVAAIVTGYGSLNPSSDRITLLSCLTQTGVAVEHLFVL